jgi:hypothetical protein
VEMTERKRNLDGKRKQRKPRAMSDVRPEPLHAAERLSSGDRTSRERYPDGADVTL